MQLQLTPFPKLLEIEPSGIMVKDKMMNMLLSNEYLCSNQSRDLHPDFFSLEEGKAFCFELLWFCKHVSYKLHDQEVSLSVFHSAMKRAALPPCDLQYGLAY
ncbi:hypothetical protein DPMN_192772 [Dreissena polymorpha]|uniref:Uncharacterized protein n=1 Tax=Dreissena polymorpha TaxID=45954 RepID=A0A9D3Y2X1_DREPO|nr:hypothetical protein DPMN_192772 [Dreissena polymorpha]